MVGNTLRKIPRRLRLIKVPLGEVNQVEAEVVEVELKGVEVVEKTVTPGTIIMRQMKLMMTKMTIMTNRS
jgi:hypothetical protein